jgi:hypothetical protein
MLYNILYFIVSTAVFFAILIFLGIKYKQESENYYPFFIFLYFLLGTFKLNIMLIPIPLGFIICLIYMGSHPVIKNRKAKKAAVLLGLLAFILGCVVPFVHTQMLEREIAIHVSSWVTDDFSFVKEYKLVLNSLGYHSLNGVTPSITDFRVNIDKNDVIDNFEYTMKFDNNEYQTVNIISNDTNQHELYIIPKAKDTSNNAFIQLGASEVSVDASMFFSELDKINLTKIQFNDTDESDFCLSQILISVPDKTAEVYLVNGDSVQQVQNVNQTGNILVCQGMKSLGNHSMQTVKTKNFLLIY